MPQSLKKILLVLTGLIFGLMLCEAGLRLFGLEYPHFYEFDPIVGARLRSGIKGYWLPEGGGYVSINSDGLRDREHAVKKPPNTLRIAILGDSFAEAMQVNREESFWAIMEEDLKGCRQLNGRHIQVINFGQAGFGTAQELLALRHRVWKYSPDVVLLAFYTGNDVSDNSPTLNQRATDPFFVLQDGKLVLDDGRTKRAEKIWLSYEKNRNWLGHFCIWRNDTFRILQVIEHSQNILRDWWLKNRRQKPGSVRQGVVGAGILYREPTDEAWKEAWKVTEAVLLNMHNEIVQKKTQFYVVVISNQDQLFPNESWGSKLATSPGVKDVFYPDHRVERLCQNHGIPVLLLGPYFQAYAAQHHVFLHGFHTLFQNTLGTGHWNQKGHRLAGEIIAQWLCPQIN